MISMLLRDLQWHDRVGVLAKTLSYAAQDLQGVLVVTVLLLGALASFDVSMFGSCGAQDMFSKVSGSFPVARPIRLRQEPWVLDTSL